MESPNHHDREREVNSEKDPVNGTTLPEVGQNDNEAGIATPEVRVVQSNKNNPVKKAQEFDGRQVQMMALGTTSELPY